MLKTKFTRLVWLIPPLCCGAGTAHAIGLGEMHVHSALGQPFRAEVPLYSDKPLPADCIKLHAPVKLGLPAPPNLKYEIRDAAGKAAHILLTTAQGAHEPVLGIGITVQCEGLLQREYAVLLDVTPPTLPTEPQAVAATPTTLPAPQSAATSKPKTLATPVQRQARIATAENTAQAGRQTAIASPKKHPEPAQARLILSGTRSMRTDNSLGLPLKLDLSLPDTTRAAERPLTESERQDDNIALSRKLDHLEQQLATLQKRNAELTKQAQLAETQARQNAQEKTGSWFALPAWVYLLTGALLLSALVAWLLYRRRHPHERFLAEDDYVIVPPAEAGAFASGAESLNLTIPDLNPRTAERSKPVAVKSAPETQSAQGKAPAAARAKSSTKSSEDGLEFWADAYIASADAELHDKLEDVVEVCLAHDNPDMAIQLLEQTIQQNPEESAAPWLTLLDLLERTKKIAQYDETRARFRQLFNINIPTPGQIQFAQTCEGIESYPHMLAELQRLWSNGGAGDYLKALLRDTRGGTRAGFDMHTYHDIIFLQELHRNDSASA